MSDADVPLLDFDHGQAEKVKPAGTVAGSIPDRVVLSFFADVIRDRCGEGRADVVHELEWEGIVSKVFAVATPRGRVAVVPPRGPGGKESGRAARLTQPTVWRATTASASGIYPWLVAEPMPPVGAPIGYDVFSKSTFSSHPVEWVDGGIDPHLDDRPREHGRRVEHAVERGA